MEIIQSDFYVYDCETSTWQMITDDTCSLGGPKPIFDHQMCIDVEQNTIYVFGGRIFKLVRFLNDMHLDLIS